MNVESMGAAAPASGEPANPAAAQPNAATTDLGTGAPEGGNPESQVQKTFTQAELDEILQKRIAKAEARAERRVLRTLERVIPQQPAPQQTSQQQAKDDRPARREGEADDDYFDRLTDWKLEQRDRKSQADTQQKQARSLADKTEAIYADAQKLPGFDRETFDDLPLTKPIVEALIESDAPAKLMHYMASNPDEVERIAKLSPARQVAELGKLELKAAETKPPARSSAPAALSPAKGSAPSSAPDPSDTKAYIRWANEAERAARR